MSDASPDPVPTLAAARPAASLLVLRHRLRGGPELLMGLRGANHKFMPNRLVFPGGRVDPEDHAVDPASDLRSHVARRLDRAGAEVLARALGVAAARELVEETGLTLAAAPGAPPHLLPLDYIARAITPDRQPIRFDARFLVVDSEYVTGTLAGSGELEDLRWYAIEQALALDLAFPTRGVIERLQDWLAMGEAEREEQEAVPTLRNRGWEME
jgi:8-oxo-dGTP pyrophosphatase MutT (NUDIX family)